MSWKVHTRNGKGYRADHWEMEGSTSADNAEGWDSATYNFMVRGDESIARTVFFDGKPHPRPECYGLYCVGVQITANKRFDALTFGTAHFLGIKGGVSGTLVRRVRGGTNLTSREVTSADLAGEYGFNEDRFILMGPNGQEVDIVRLHGQQNYAEVQLVTTVSPENFLKIGTLKKMAPAIPLNEQLDLDALGVRRVFNYPSQELCSSCQYEQHPAGLPIWLVDVRWERVPEYENT